MTRPRTAVLAGVVLVALTATASTALAVRREAGVDRDARADALARVQLAAISNADPRAAGVVFTDDSSGWSGGILNDGGAPVEVLRAGFPGEPRERVDAVLVPGQALAVPAGTGGCPEHRLTEGFDVLEVEVGVPGGSAVVRLPVANPEQVREGFNGRCQLFSAASSVSTSYLVARQQPGLVVLDLAVVNSGREPLSLVAVHSGPGITVTADRPLPLALPRTRTDGTVDVRADKDLRLTFRLTDCAAVEAAPTPQVDGGAVVTSNGGTVATTWNAFRLDVQQPDQPSESSTPQLSPQVADLLVQQCDVPPLPRQVFG